MTLCIGFASGCIRYVDPAPPAPPPAGWTLVWNDEFSGADGSKPDAAKWSYDEGAGGWGNNELEFYTTSAKNAVVRKGVLEIIARKENRRDKKEQVWQYTSARIQTRGKFAQKYGRIEARIKIPEGQGMWPAFWMLGENVKQARWPECGEIDIMENIGKEPGTVHGTLHGPGYSHDHGLTAEFSLPQGEKFAGAYHVFAVEWEPEAIHFSVDEHLYSTRTPKDVPEGSKWVFDHPFFIILNVAVGGDWPGNPDATTKFPQKMLVDYVRVYSRGEATTLH